MIIDACVHIGESIFENGTTLENLYETMDYLNAKKALLCPVKPKNYILSDANDYVIKLIKEDKRLLGLVRVDPNRGEEALKEVERGIKKGLKGIYLNPWEENYQINDPIVNPIMNFARINKLPVLIEAGYPWVSHATQVYDLARNYKDVRIIVNNAGQLDLSGFSLFDVTTLLKSCNNVYVITNTAVGTGWLESIINDVSEDRVLFGTGIPIFDHRLEILRIEYLEGVSEEYKKKVLGGNFLKLFDCE